MQDERDGDRRKALIFLLFGVLSFGLSGVLIKLCRFPPAFIASFRMILAGAVLAPFCLRAWPRFVRERGVAGVLLLLVPGVLLGLHFQAWVAGIKLTTVATATFIFSINPLFFALAERFVRRRKIPSYALIALTVVLAGAVWLFWAKGGRLEVGEDLRGDLLCLLSTLLFVVYLLVSRWVTQTSRFARGRSARSRGRDPLEPRGSSPRPGVPHHLYIHVVYLGGGLATLPLAFAGEGFGGLEIQDTVSTLALVALALFPTLIGHTANNYAVRFLPPLTVSFFTLAEPLLATVAAVLVLNELPVVLEVPTYVLFLAATVFYLVRSRGAPLEELPRKPRSGATCGRRRGSSR
jgi:drug/metabolite transporter (DMT)-like permease